MSRDATPLDVIEGRAKWCVVCADNRDVLPTLPKVDAVVTDPPYGIGFKYASHVDSIDEYECMMRETVRMTDAVLDEDSPRAFFQANIRISEAHKWFPPGFRIAAACRTFVQIRPGGLSHAFDPVVWWGKSRRKAGTDEFWRDWHVANNAGDMGKERLHPCPRPESTMEYFVGLFTACGHVVLDPFCGSGTTGVACLRLGRRFIGIEKDPTYAAVAIERLEAESRGLTLRDARAGQLSLLGDNP